MRSKSPSRQKDVRPANEMGVGNREIVLVKQRHALWHARLEAVGLDRDPSSFALALLELRGQHDIQKWIAGSPADPAARCGLDVFEQKTSVVIDAKIDRNIEVAAADFAETAQTFERLPAPESTVLGEEIINANFVCDA